MAKRPLTESSYPLAATADISRELGALSHDLTANLMLLEASLKQLKKSCEVVPLAGIAQGFVQVEACLRESKRFIEDLRHLGQAGQLQLLPTRLSLDPLVRSVLEEQSLLLIERRICVQVGTALPAIWCNESRVRQLLTNLVRNAALHGCDPQQPQITISAVPAAAPEPSIRAGSTTPNWVWVSVCDNGPGIARRYRRAIFRPGKRLAGTQAPGTGLGLSIAQQIVTHYGGKIWLDDVQPGTTLTFSLPAAPQPVRSIAVLPEPHLFRGNGSARRAQAWTNGANS